MAIPKLPTGYRFDERGLIWETDAKVVANFFLEPVKAYCYPGDTLPSFCDIAVVQGGRHIPLKNRVELSKLTAAWWKKPPPGCCYAPEARAPHRKMAALFHELLGRLEAVTIYQPATLGWDILPTGEHVYVTGGGAIGADGYLPKDQVWIPGAMARYQMETLRSAPEEDAAEYFWRLYRVLPGITDILLANALAAVLFPCFKEAGIESRFPLVLEGPSEAKKTTLACLAGSLYNRKSDLRGSVATLTSTNRALERRGVELRHTTVVFDDLFPDGGGALEQKALSLIRNIANQVPRESCSGKALEGSAMECGAVITAEAFPNCERSTRTRCLRLALSEPVPNHLLLPVQERPELLGNVLQTFIMRTAENFEKITRQIAEDFQEYREGRAQPEAPPAASERLYEIGFVLYTALKVYFSQEYRPDSTKTEEELANFKTRLNKWIVWQLSPQAAPGRGWVVAATAELAKRQPYEFRQYKNHPGYLCILPKHLCYLLQKYYGAETINVSDIMRQLRDEQLLSIDKSDAATKKIKDEDGKSRRYLYIDKRRLLQL